MSRKSIVNSFTRQSVLSGVTTVGEYESIINVAEINVTFSGVQSNGASGITIRYQYSNDGVNTAESPVRTVLITSNNYNIKLDVLYKYFRISFTTNTNNAVTNLNLTTIFKNSISYDINANNVIVESGSISIKDTAGGALTSVAGALNVNILGGEAGGIFYPPYQGVTGQVAISNLPVLQGVTGTVGITGTVPVSGTFYQTYQGVTGQVAISNLPALQGVTGTVGITGTVPVSGTFFQEYQGVTGQVAISNYPSTQSTKIVPTSDIPFVSRSLGNTGLVVASLSKVLRNLSLAKSDEILTYVYIYDKATAATSGDTPKFLFIIKNFVGIQLTLNHLFLLGISIRATSDLNGTTSPTADTVFANITFSTP